MLDVLLSPLQYEFLQRGMLAAVLIGVLCSTVGCFVVLRSMAFLGDAMAHAILPGIAIAYLAGFSLTAGALAAGIIVATGIALLSRRGAMREDTAIGILFSSALALGIAIISSMRSYSMDLSHILFGDILGVSIESLIAILVFSAVILGVLYLIHRPLIIFTFDPVLAAALRLPVEPLRVILLVLISVTIVASVQIVGVALVTAMLVTPAAAAHLLTRRLRTMVFLSALIGASSALIGLYVSYYLNIASGAAIVLAATVCFVAAFLFSPRKGVLKAWIGMGRNIER